MCVSVSIAHLWPTGSITPGKKLTWQTTSRLFNRANKNWTVQFGSIQVRGMERDERDRRPRSLMADWSELLPATTYRAARFFHVEKKLLKNCVGIFASGYCTSVLNWKKMMYLHLTQVETRTDQIFCTSCNSLFLCLPKLAETRSPGKCRKINDSMFTFL